jgi:hypothetical protein
MKHRSYRQTEIPLGRSQSAMRRIVPQDDFSGAGVCQSDILNRLESPDTIAACEYGKDQRVDLVRAGRRSGRRRGAGNYRPAFSSLWSR